MRKSLFYVFLLFGTTLLTTNLLQAQSDHFAYAITDVKKKELTGTFCGN
jgi:hypothetical protein